MPATTRPLGQLLGSRHLLESWCWGQWDGIPSRHASVALKLLMNQCSNK